MKQDLLDYLYQFMIQSNWADEKVPEQARAIFTTICFIGNINADTKACDGLLNALYQMSLLEELIEYDEFKNFMLELLV